VTYKEQMNQQKADAAAAAAKSAEQQAAKQEELTSIADGLEAHLKANKPSEVGLTLARDKSRMRLSSDQFTIVIDAGYVEYTGMVLLQKQGSSAETIAPGSRIRLNTLADVDRYIIDIVNQ
jgi:hypothetical protein